LVIAISSSEDAMQAVIASFEDLGRLVRHAREAHGLSQHWLSELESGKGKQINARYFAVLDALGIRLSAALSDD